MLLGQEGLFPFPFSFKKIFLFEISEGNFVNIDNQRRFAPSITCRQRMGCQTFVEQLIAIHGSAPTAKSRTQIWRADILNTVVQLDPSPDYCDLAAPVWCGLFTAFLYLLQELSALPVCPMTAWAVMFSKLVPVFLHRSSLNFLPVFSVCCILQAKPWRLCIVEDMQYHSSFSPREWLGMACWAPQGAHSTKADRAQEVFGQCSQAHAVTLWVLCSGPGVQLDDPGGSLPAQHILWLYDLICNLCAGALSSVPW